MDPWYEPPPHMLSWRNRNRLHYDMPVEYVDPSLSANPTLTRNPSLTAKRREWYPTTADVPLSQPQMPSRPQKRKLVPKKGEKEVDIPDGPFAKALREHCRQEDLSPPLFVACNFVQGFGVEVRYGDGKSSKVQPQKSQEVTKERAAYLALSELGVSTAKVAMKNLTEQTKIPIPEVQNNVIIKDSLFTCILCPSKETKETKSYVGENALREHVGRKHWNVLLVMTDNSIVINSQGQGESLDGTVYLECKFCINRQSIFQSEESLRQHIVCSHINLQRIAKECLSLYESPLLDDVGNAIAAATSADAATVDGISPDSESTTFVTPESTITVKPESTITVTPESTTTVSQSFEPLSENWYDIKPDKKDISEFISTEPKVNIDRIICEHCPNSRSFNNQNAYRQHLHGKHDIAPVSRKNKVYCDVCRKGCKDEEALKAHMLVKHLDRPPDSEPLCEVFSCQYCTRCDFPSENSLVIHIERKHPNEWKQQIVEKSAGKEL